MKVSTIGNIIPSNTASVSSVWATTILPLIHAQEHHKVHDDLLLTPGLVVILKHVQGRFDTGKW